MYIQLFAEKTEEPDNVILATVYCRTHILYMTHPSRTVKAENETGTTAEVFRFVTQQAAEVLAGFPSGEPFCAKRFFLAQTSALKF